MLIFAVDLVLKRTLNWFLKDRIHTIQLSLKGQFDVFDKWEDNFVMYICGGPK